MLGGLADQAERESRPVVVVSTAPVENEASPGAIRMMTAADARRLFHSLHPKPWPTDRPPALNPLLAEPSQPGSQPGGLAAPRPGSRAWRGPCPRGAPGGDTMVDAKLARAGGAGLSVIVETGVGSGADLAAMAAPVLPSVADLSTVLM